MERLFADVRNLTAKGQADRSDRQSGAMPPRIPGGCCSRSTPEQAPKRGDVELPRRGRFRERFLTKRSKPTSYGRRSRAGLDVKRADASPNVAGRLGLGSIRFKPGSSGPTTCGSEDSYSAEPIRQRRSAESQHTEAGSGWRGGGCHSGTSTEREGCTDERDFRASETPNPLGRKQNRPTSSRACRRMVVLLLIGVGVQWIKRSRRGGDLNPAQTANTNVLPVGNPAEKVSVSKLAPTPKTNTGPAKDASSSAAPADVKPTQPSESRKPVLPFTLKVTHHPHA